MTEFKQNSYLFGSNAIFIEELYEKYITDPNSVNDEWKVFFSRLSDAPQSIKSAVKGPSWKGTSKKIIGAIDKITLASTKAPATSTTTADIKKCIAAANLINAYRTYGHFGVKLDPLELVKPTYNPELDYKFHGLTDADLDAPIDLAVHFEIKSTTIRSLLEFLKSAYSSRVGTEFMHIENAQERQWFQSQIESSMGAINISKEEKLKALQDIMEAESFESFAHTKFSGTKRFSVEGGESMIAAIEVVIQTSVSQGVHEIVLGMAHRGRLNTLTKIFHKPYHAMFSEFKGNLAYPDGMQIPGDVKYHLGNSADVIINDTTVHLSLTPNPSHLEVVNSVVLGRVRAKQDQLNDHSKSKVLGIQIHGDAAFSGQGSVMESLSLSQLNTYHTGGSIHIVINNQIGFTTNPVDSRSTSYCTDIAKFINAPIMHVNGDDAEAVVYASKIASNYRAKFKKDVVLDIVCYRKYGHNEGDEPFFTQPQMYAAIKSMQNPAEVYAAKLINSGVLTAVEFQAKKTKFKNFLEAEFVKSQTYKPLKADWLEGKWSKFERAKTDRVNEETGVELKVLKQIGKALSQAPSEFAVNPKIAKQLELKKQMFDTGLDFDWGTAEALAYGSLLAEGYKVRMTGQDVERGTFSHRHAVLVDQNHEYRYTPLNNISQNQAKIEICNSNLSEFAVLGFEYGYSYTEPKALTIWEGQFGDFANGAQVIIDQYISSGEAKWLRMSGLVMLLPHGYEGQGPEHSSARLERFLQLCAKDNMQVVNCTTPASFFHVLRRQMIRNFRKPLIVMSPKSLLRHKMVVSDLKEMAVGTSFQKVISETAKIAPSDKVKKLIMCSGKVYYDLIEKRANKNISDIAIIRLEQLYPFPSDEIKAQLLKYPNAEITWVQEEHENMGGYFHVNQKMDKIFQTVNHKSKKLNYIGRGTSASPAVGYMKQHLNELEQLLNEALA